MYPWLKGHGSFEALRDFPKTWSICTYPWLKGHGSFEARLAKASPSELSAMDTHITPLHLDGDMYPSMEP